MSKKKATAAEAPARADLPDPTPQEQASTAAKIDAALLLEDDAKLERGRIVDALLREAETGRAGLGDSAQLRQVAAWIERGCR